MSAPSSARLRSPGTVPRTPALERWLQHVSLALVTISGTAYAIMKYLLEPDPEAFTVVNHPWQPHALHLHVWASPVLVLGIGMLLRGHVVRRLMNRGWRRARRTGTLLSALLLPMVASGYLLQTATSEAWRDVLVVVHLATGGIYAVGYLAHVAVARRAPP